MFVGFCFMPFHFGLWDTYLPESFHGHKFFWFNVTVYVTCLWAEHGKPAKVPRYSGENCQIRTLRHIVFHVNCGPFIGEGMALTHLSQQTSWTRNCVQHPPRNIHVIMRQTPTIWVTVRVGIVHDTTARCCWQQATLSHCTAAPNSNGSQTIQWPVDRHRARLVARGLIWETRKVTKTSKTIPCQRHCRNCWRFGETNRYRIHNRYHT